MKEAKGGMKREGGRGEEKHGTRKKGGGKKRESEDKKLKTEGRREGRTKNGKAKQMTFI